MGLFRRTPELLDQQRHSLAAATPARPTWWRRVVFSDRAFTAVLTVVFLVEAFALMSRGTSRGTATIVSFATAGVLLVTLSPSWKRLRRWGLGLPPPAPRRAMTEADIDDLMNQPDGEHPGLSRSWSIDGSVGGGEHHVETRSSGGADGEGEHVTYSGSFTGMLWFLLKRMFSWPRG